MSDQEQKLDIVKHGGNLTVSVELLGDVDAAGIAEAVRRALTALRPTPQEAAERREREARERAAVREQARTVRPSLARVVERMGWSWAYLDHLVQPYCTCGPHGPDGEWVVCEHADDLGVTG